MSVVEPMASNTRWSATCQHSACAKHSRLAHPAELDAGIPGACPPRQLQAGFVAAQLLLPPPQAAHAFAVDGCPQRRQHANVPVALAACPCG